MPDYLLLMSMIAPHIFHFSFVAKAREKKRNTHLDISTDNLSLRKSNDQDIISQTDRIH